MFKSKPKISFNKHDSISLVIYAVHILLNFLGMPQIKYVFLASVIYFIYLAFRKSWSELFIPTFVLFFLEGQGRIVWEYNAVSRIIFDLFLVVVLLRHTVQRYSLDLPKQLPLFFRLMIIGHFGWYFVQFFNVASVGILGPIFATKVYIFPILMFFMFIEKPLPNDDVSVYSRNSAVLFILLAQLALIFFQFSQGDSSLLDISSYYSRPMRGDVFSGDYFRPFGTSFVPGAMSVYFAFALGFCFLPEYSGFIRRALKIILYILAIAACFIMQVRVGLILTVIVIGLSTFMMMFYSRYRIVHFFFLLCLFYTLPFLIKNLDMVQEWFPDSNLKPAIIRIQNITTLEGLAAQRASFSTFAETFWDRLSKAPLGVGPGRTGAANSQFVTIIKNDPRFDMDFSWTLDNLYISLVIDLGIGMIFYTILILGLPLYVFGRYIRQWQVGRNPSNGAIIALICVAANLLTTWGAISIPYNPSSFFFWFWLAYAMNQLDENPISSQPL